MKKKSVKMVRAGKKAWKTRLRNKGSLRRKKGLPKRAVGFYREDGKTKPITKSEADLNRARVIEQPSTFKAVRPTKNVRHILQEVTDKIIKKHKLKSSYDINNSYCEEWANEVCKRIPKAWDVGTPEREWNEEEWAAGHVWVEINGINYDAETMEGVKDWRDLKIFRSARARLEKKAASLSGPFKFEPIAFVWKDGQTKEIERMRIRKDSPSLITHLRIEHLVPANKGDAFFKSPRSGTVEVANEHIVMLGVPVFKEYYLVSESFTMKNAVGDPLGGFSSGRIWEIANKPKFLEVLEKYSKEGWRQVPYVQGGSTCKHCGKSLAGEPVSSFRSQTCPACYRKLPLKSGSDHVTKAYLTRYSQLKKAGVNPSLENLIPTAGTPSLVTDTITRYLRNKESLSPADKKEIGRYMVLMRPLFPLGVPKLIRDIAIAYPPSEIRGMHNGIS